MQKKLMGTSAVVGLAVLGALLLSGHNGVSQAAGETSAEWEHLALTNDLKQDAAADVARRINKLGGEGWQLVDVEGVSDNGTTTKTVYYFKRQG